MLGCMYTSCKCTYTHGSKRPDRWNNSCCRAVLRRPCLQLRKNHTGPEAAAKLFSRMEPAERPRLGKGRWGVHLGGNAQEAWAAPRRRSAKLLTLTVPDSTTLTGDF
eukprot:GHVT01060107.1.p1 GENE.GHVT01060107.1~~GHVT01060107.1.p1  ORF type:complete len:107 (+),score=8.06 GHVT01060107.1:409-729(+)